jgi:hypothetical protein
MLRNALDEMTNKANRERAMQRHDEKLSENKMETLMTNATPNTKIRTLIHERNQLKNINNGLEQKIIQLEYKDTLFCCKHKIDKRLLIFISQITLILVLIIFSIVETVRQQTCEDRSPFVGLLTTMVGVLLPSPTL